MAMVCGLDLHREQITFDALELSSGETWKGRIWQPDRARFRRWLLHDVAERAHGEADIAVEGCTGWRYVVEEIQAAGYRADLAEPAEAQAARGPKHRAKTDRSDAALLRKLLQEGGITESWVPPPVVLEWRERLRLYKSVVDQRTQWCQRVHAELYHHGIVVPEGATRSPKTRAILADPYLTISAAGRERITVAYRMIDACDAEASPLKKTLQRFGERQPACRALIDSHYGIGEVLAVVVWSEFGDCRRFSRSDQVVRHTGLDVVVDSSDRRRAGRVLVASGTRDVALGSLRSGQERLKAGQPRPRLLCRGQGPPWGQDCGALGRPPLLSRAPRGRPRRGLRHPTIQLVTSVAAARNVHPKHHGHPRSAPSLSCPPASVPDGLRTMTRPPFHHVFAVANRTTTRWFSGRSMEPCPCAEVVRRSPSFQPLILRTGTQIGRLIIQRRQRGQPRISHL